MISQFLDKFKGRVNKISKEGFNQLFQKSGRLLSKPAAAMKKSQGKQIQSQMQRKKQKKTLKNTSPNKQNKITKNISYSAAQLKNHKQNTLKKRQALTLKFQKTDKNQSQISKKQLLKLPKIQTANKQRQKLHFKATPISQSQQNSLFTQNYKKNLRTEIKDQKQQKSKGFDNFLDQQGFDQLKKLNQFQNLVIQRQVMKSLASKQFQNLKKSKQYVQKRVTVHQ